MFRWQYRRMLTDTGRIEMREGYFDADGQAFAWTGEPADVWGEDEAELADDLLAMVAALDLPVLIEAELPRHESPDDDPGDGDEP
jgi:hypothetical protein